MAERHAVDSCRLTIDGVEVHYLEAGRGRPILLVHGLGSSGYLEWRMNLLRLADRRHVLAPDLPGYGMSDKPSGHRYSIRYFADVLEQFLDRRQLDAVDVAGVSMGGRVALALALEQPHRVRSLTLVNSLGLGRPGVSAAPYPLLAMPGLGEWLLERTRGAMRSLSFEQLRLLTRVRWGRGQPLDDDTLHYLREITTDPGFGEAYLSTVRGMADAFGLRRGVIVTGRLHELRMPVLIVWGERDRLFPVSHAHNAHKLIPSSRLEVMAGSGHNPQLEQPELFNRVLLDFLSTVSPAA